MLISQFFSSAVEPGRLGGFVSERKQHNDADDDRWHCLEQEDPFPPGITQPTVQPEDRGGNRRAESHGDRQRQREARNDAGAVMVGEPIGEQQNDTGEQTGLGKSEQQPDGQEAGRTGGERGGTGDQSPGDHDPRDPNARADLVENHVARHFEQAVADVERRGAEAVGGRCQPDIRVHLQRGEADVDAVEIAEEVDEHGERQQPQVHLAHRLSFDRRAHCSSPERHICHANLPSGLT